MDVKDRIRNLESDVEKRIRDELRIIGQADNPEKELNLFIKTLRWRSPDLAAHMKRIASSVFNSQYYSNQFGGGFEAIDCGYCGTKNRNVRPGDRCKEYMEASNISWFGQIVKTVGSSES